MDHTSYADEDSTERLRSSHWEGINTDYYTKLSYISRIINNIMSTLDLFNLIQASAVARYIGSLNHLYCAFMELVHIAGMLQLLTSILLTSLNLLGLGLRNVPVRLLHKTTASLFWWGLSLLGVIKSAGIV